MNPLPPPVDWHCIPADDALARLGTDAASGLTKETAVQRFASAGPNRIESARTGSTARLFLRQFSNIMILILVAAAAVSGMIGEWSDSIVIGVILLLNAVIGFVQEFRAERAMAALEAIAAPTAQVIRDGSPATIAADELVPGDVVVLEAGTLVPADLRLLEAAGLSADESALTGESVTVDKQATGVVPAESPIGDRSNMTFRGTLVTQGRGRGLVVATGMDTELGRIAHLLTEEARAVTPLQRRLGRFARRLALVILAACGVILVAGLLRGEPPLLMVMTAISLAVAAIPEALPAVVTISLALGAHRMVRHSALIRRLPATETLGSVTYICADKTGTLTLNSMEAERFFIPGECLDSLPDHATTDERWRTLTLAMILNNDATALEDGWTGDPTEIALHRAALSSGVAETLQGDQWPRVGELPFDATRKRMTTLHRTDGRFVALTKGAPETVIPLCDSASREEALAEAGKLATEGYRVLAFARREFTDEPAVDEDLETGLAFIGLVGLMDPARPEAPRAVAESRKAGIKPVMITGDHPATALAIARRLGIASETDEVLTGPQLQKLDDADRSQRLPGIAVYARMSPEQKIEIVRTLQESGEFVAMTGDGVNDAPALKKANIGIAMGLKGTDVAREAADMVLLDDNFATIVAAIRAGRRIYDNIRKFVRYTMTSNTGEVLSLFIAPLIGLPLPLVPIQILWINLVTDGLPGLALTVEKGEPDLMERPPRAPDEGIFARGLWQQTLWMGTLIALLTLGTQAWAIDAGSDHWQTMAFTVLTFSQLANALAVRAERESLFSIGLLSNRPLLATVVLSIGVQLAVVYVPALQKLFHTQALTAAELAVCLALPVLVVAASEAEKWFVRHRGLYAETN